MDSHVFPTLLHTVSIGSLVVAILCASLVTMDEIRHPQRMWIMNLVWPLTTLFGSIVWLWFYFRHGRQSAHTPNSPERKRTDSITVAKAATHCGAGCTLGDLLGEGLVLIAPGVAVWFGWHSLFQEKMIAAWIVDFIFAYLCGIAFQYFTITPMQHLSLKQGLIRALKVDTASIAAWQVGMYGVMAMIQFLWFSPSYGRTAPASTPEFWFAMQLAMLAGFFISYPVNAFLLHQGTKEPM